MALNGISTLSSKQAKQEAKLEIAEAKRQGKTVVEGGGSYSITGTVDPGKNYYRRWNVADIDILPTKYSGNAVVDNTADGNVLTLTRPWTDTAYFGYLSNPADNPESAVSITTFDTMQFWLDAADTDTIVPEADDESDITQWNDKSILEHNAIPSDASSRPSYENTTLQNGYGYLQFENGTDKLEVDLSTDLQGETGFTLITVAKLLNVASPGFLSSTDDGDLSIKTRFGGLGTGTYIDVGMKGQTYSWQWGFADIPASFHIYTLRYDGTSPNLTFRLDGSQKISQSSGIPSTTSASNTKMYIGADSSGANGWRGYVGETLLFKRAIGLNEMFNLEHYLGNKWGITI